MRKGIVITKYFCYFWNVKRAQPKSTWHSAGTAAQHESQHNKQQNKGRSRHREERRGCENWFALIQKLSVVTIQKYLTYTPPSNFKSDYSKSSSLKLAQGQQQKAAPPWSHAWRKGEERTSEPNEL